jgi:DNA-directed RNA polymerase specialized sigma24 family protein
MSRARRPQPAASRLRRDDDAFRSIIEPHRPALHAHCYRMLGSLHEMLGSADGDATPEARYERREMLEPALIAALQYLSARQRAVFFLRDVLGFSAEEVADSLEITVASVNGAILRARRALKEQLLEQSQPATLQVLGNRRLRELVERFADAFERGEVDAILVLLAEDTAFASRTTGVRQAGVSAVGGAGPVFDRPGVSAAEREPAADQRRSSCGYSPTTDSSPASRSRRSIPTSRRRSPTSGGCGRRGSSERTTPAPTNPVS